MDTGQGDPGSSIPTPAASPISCPLLKPSAEDAGTVEGFSISAHQWPLLMLVTP